MDRECQPIVSVIVPTYNNAEYLPRALDSLLSQTLTSFEVLIIDDGSTDDTQETVSEYTEKERFKYRKHLFNQGGGAARNTGIMMAKGKYIAFLDADDTWSPKKLECQVQYLENHPQFNASYCNVRHVGRFKSLRTFLHGIFISEDRKTFESGGEELIPAILNMDFDPGGASTLVVRRSLVEHLGGFDPHFERHQDLEFLIRLLKESPLGYIDRELVTKYETPSPDAKTVSIAKVRYFKKFKEDINKYEKEGVPIRESHKFDLARLYFQEGNLSAGAQYLNDIHLTQDRVIILIWSLYLGIIYRFRKNIH